MSNRIRAAALMAAGMAVATMTFAAQSTPQTYKGLELVVSRSGPELHSRVAGFTRTRQRFAVSPERPSK